MKALLFRIEGIYICHVLVRKYFVINIILIVCPSVSLTANQGEAFSYGSLGTIRYEGIGFIKDDVETYKFLKLATLSMPEGKAKQDEMKRLKSLSSRMNHEDIERAELLVRRRKPLTGFTTYMRDKDDR